MALLLCVFISVVPSGDLNAQSLSGKWKKNNKGWWYEFSDGSYAKNEFIEYKGNSYYFNTYGYMVTGWREIKSKENNQRGGKEVHWYFFKSDGSMAKNEFIKYKGDSFYFNAYGYMVTGWRQIKEYSQWTGEKAYWYYFKPDGSMAKSEYIKGYYFDSNGICYDDRQFKWKKEYDSRGTYYWVYVDADNEYNSVGWTKIDNVYYYFDYIFPMGNHPPLLTDRYIGNDKDGYYYVDKNGAWTYKGKLYKVEENYLLQYHWYGHYKDTKGWVPRNCIINIEGHRVKFDSSGKVVSYWWYPDEEIVVKYP